MPDVATAVALTTTIIVILGLLLYVAFMPLHDKKSEARARVLSRLERIARRNRGRHQ